MKKLILLIAISLIISCKKEKQVEPTPIQPVIVAPALTNKGSVVFYFPGKPSYTYGNIEIFVNNVSNGKITMMPSGWIPSCNTIGWGLHCTNGIGTYSWEVKVTKSTNNYSKTGTFIITEKSCESINVSQ